MGYRKEKEKKTVFPPKRIIFYRGTFKPSLVLFQIRSNEPIIV